MAASVFLHGNEVWKDLTGRIRDAKRVYASVAYFGKGGLRWAPLSRGDVLVIDMSIGACKQGVTDPREIRKLVRRGVRVFSKANLHAKVVVADDVAIVGSANVSGNSANVLDEAAVVTESPGVVHAARNFIRSLCTEPVRPLYLKKCIAAYRPPQFKAAHHTGGSTKRRTQARIPLLWILGGLRYRDLPKNESEKAADAAERAKKLLRSASGTFVDQITFDNRIPVLRRLKSDSWVITAVKTARGAEIWPPRQLLSIDSYSRARGKRRWLLHFEAPNAEQAIPLGEFRRRTSGILPNSRSANLRTRPIFEGAKAQAIHSLWTSAGRVSKR